MGVLFLPDLRAARGLSPVRWPKTGSPSAILHERARHFASGEVEGALSVKCMFGGRAHYETEGRRVAVDDDCYLVLNHAQPYSMEIASEAPVESFCVFFQPGLVEDVCRSLASRDDRLLDSPHDESALFRVFDRRYRHDDLVTPRLLALRRSVSTRAAATEIEEGVYALASALLQAQIGAWRKAERIPAARAGTREELYRRLHHARDLIESLYAQPLSIADMATVACLSPYHFLRQYRLLFGISPQQHLLSVRLRAARKLLATSELPIAEIAARAGFESPSHFTTAFRRHEGDSPRAFRSRHVVRRVF